jgi:hypothetical protein
LARNGQKKSDSGARRGRTGVIVLGMHRSGTGALTRVLGLLGCDLPKTLMDGNKTNETGHWESTPVCRLNDRMLESAGSSWDDWLPLNPDWFRSPKVEEFRAEAAGLLASEFGASSFFVLKDPRNCRLLPFWLDVFADAGVEPVVVSIARNPLEVAASLKARNGFDPAFAHLLWLRHVLDAEAGSRGLRRCFTTYDELMDDWVRLADRAQKALGLVWPRSAAAAADEVEAFLAPHLRHHSEPKASVAQDPRLSPWLKESFGILARWAGEGEARSDHKTLDGFRAGLGTAAPAFSRLISSGRQASARAANLEREMEARAHGHEKRAAELEGQLTGVREELGERIVTLRTELEARTSAASEAEAAARDLRGRLAATESALAQRSLEAEETAAELSAAREELRLAQKALATDDEVASGLKKQVGQLRAELEARTSAATEAEVAARDLRDRLAVTESALAQRSLEAEETAAELSAAREELRLARKAIATDEKVTAGLKEHVDLLLADLKERATAHVALEAMGRDAKRERDEALAAERKAAEARAGFEAARKEMAARLERQDAELAELRRELGAARAAAEKARAESAAAMGKAEADARDAQAAQAAHAAELEKARGERAALEGRIRARFDEIAAMTRMMAESERDAEASRAAADRMRRDAAKEMGRAVKAMLEGPRLVPGRFRLRRQAEMLKRSGLFDARWYLENYPDVAENGGDPALHYLLYGAEEGREPNGALANGRE